MEVDDPLAESIADSIWMKLIGANFDVVEHDLKLRLAIEQRLNPSQRVPFGLDRLSTVDAGAYMGIQPETLRDRVKRRRLDLPDHYAFAKKLFWRRSDLDAWLERHRTS